MKEEGILVRGHILTGNGSYIPSEDVLGYFNNKGCPFLKGNPNIFLFQFCRGGEIDHGMRAQHIPIFTRETVTDDSADHQVQPIQFLRSFEDMLIEYSTLPGN